MIATTYLSHGGLLGSFKMTLCLILEEIVKNAIAANNDEVTLAQSKGLGFDSVRCEVDKLCRPRTQRPWYSAVVSSCETFSFMKVLRNATDVDSPRPSPCERRFLSRSPQTRHLSEQSRNFEKPRMRASMVIRSSKLASILPSTRQTCRSFHPDARAAEAFGRADWACKGHWQFPPMRCISVLKTVSYLAHGWVSFLVFAAWPWSPEEIGARAAVGRGTGSAEGPSARNRLQVLEQALHSAPLPGERQFSAAYGDDGHHRMQLAVNLGAVVQHREASGHFQACSSLWYPAPRMCCIHKESCQLFGSMPPGCHGCDINALK